MDFLKTLMLYMSLTFATSVQGVPMPEVTPEPTAVPAAITTPAAVQEDPLAAVTAVLPTEQITPEPTAAPDPTITPNTRYTNVRQGQRGDNVKKLQKRLIELGYLDKGSADGAFGNQTRRALIAFQKANGLTADGVAGDATQTHLYENPDVIKNPDLATATPTAAPSSTPEPIIPAPAEATALPTSTPVPVFFELLSGASIVYNDGSAPLAALRQEDGVTVAHAPCIYRMEDGRLQLSLPDLTDAIDDWSLTTAGEGISLTASGYVVSLMRIGGQYSCMVDGQSIDLAEGDVVLINDEVCVTTDFLQKAMNAETIWDGDESTLILHVEPKSQAGDND